MSPERWEEIQGLFAKALGLGAKGRSFVETEAGDDAELRDEVLSLLDAHAEAAQTTFLAESVLARNDDALGALPDGLPVIDRYHWVGRLGEGGMGSVYLAVRADDAYQQKVAIKLLRRDLDHEALIRRFHRERQILAELDHPNIARLLDGGESADGRPYLVMEHVEGWPIDVYCRRHGLDIAARLRLVIKVCAAVHAAHQRLVVHRDLKPANILVTADGEPKLLDFGIAKNLGPRPELSLAMTAPGQMPMTPEYASPEQMRGLAVSTASDIYSLGVLLYELLVGRRPLEVRGLPADRALKRLLEEIPTRLSSALLKIPPTDLDPGIGDPGSRRRQAWARKLSGDLDAIVATTLAKEPARRYGSAQALAQDLDRHLTGLPVSARGNSVFYLAGRFIRRQWLPVAIALVALIGQTALIIGLTLQRAETVRQRDRATAVAETLVEIFENADPGRARGETLAAREVLDSGLERIAGLRDQPQLQADLQITMGRVYTSLGLLPPALELLEQALKTRRGLHGGDHPDTAEALELLAQVLHDADRPERATELLEEAVESRRRLHGPEAPEVATALEQLASVLHRQGNLETAEGHYAEALRIRRQLATPGPLATALNSLGTLERDLGHYDEAAALHREAITKRRSAEDDPNDPELAWSLANLGTALRFQGAYEDAEAAYSEAETIQRHLYSEPHPLLAYTLDQLGLLRLSESRIDEAESLFTEALDIRTEVFGDVDARVADSRANLAKVAWERGDLEAAEAGFSAALGTLRQVLPAGHKDLATAMNHRAEVLVKRGDLEAAEALFEEALGIQRRHFGDQHRSVALLLNNLARSVSARGDHGRATELREEAVEILRRRLGADHPDLAILLYNLGVSHHHAGHVDRATEIYLQAQAIAEASLGEEHPLRVNLRRVLEALEKEKISNSNA